jgi:hypothetical protein
MEWLGCRWSNCNGAILDTRIPELIVRSGSKNCQALRFNPSSFLFRRSLSIVGLNTVAFADRVVFYYSAIRKRQLEFRIDCLAVEQLIDGR